MFENEIKSISEEYFNYLKKESRFLPLENETIEFYSPIVDFFGDSISVNISFTGSQYKLTDHGETLWNMEQFGIDLIRHKQQKKYQFLKNIMDNNGLVLENDTLTLYTSRKNLPQAIHEYILTISEISNLAILKKENIKSMFRDEVIGYFLKNRDLYPNIFPKFKIEGKSKLMHNFDAVFPGPTTEYVKAIKHINTNTAKNALFDWDDVEAYRNQTYDANARLNIIIENEDDMSDAVSTMLSQYNVRVLSFNHKEELVRKFSTV
ncbi:DUF1828 domain-containing protein [Staphylococcus intermedius]|uniref:Domain of uncharacterized function DUF1828 n=1 Tax=Staphylococcus intermedius NCTC 11048 TaxID=1141106 RepID=A0A380GAS3_STAIN|nr:DUF1828 domain-containing protein [Staphylococcus intermedius]PCF65410.1 hypothetical protein B5C04_04990 [Staphylococcus intermedius]PCF81088.1 hypothetical protein B4W74_05340 [Staphylococcus intermedius]PCF82370.1 hypothetical protein B4W70_04985 [Staphylococcus intermedius]PCF87071.1 hypothetical protein B4W75_08255 [Staphylococcus intermedius]PNZ54260.1 DUF1828 domain-containing protein [Staphylococcus intermedius NCTC 11048]